MFKKIYVSLIALSFCTMTVAESLDAVDTSGGQIVFGGIPGPGDMLWDNTAITMGTSGLLSVQGNNLASGADRTNTADDFVVPVGMVWTVDFVFSTGFSTGTTDPDGFGVVFYADAGGLPGAVVAEEQITFGGLVNNGSQELTLATPVVLGAGTYWVSVYASYDNFVDLTTHRWNWFFGSSQIGADNVLQDTIGLVGGTSWATCGTLGVADCFSFNFALRGTAGTVVALPPAVIPSLNTYGILLFIIVLMAISRRKFIENRK